MWAFFAPALAAAAAAALLLLRRYSSPSVPLVVKAATTYAWLVAFGVLVRPRAARRAARRPGPRPRGDPLAAPPRARARRRQPARAPAALPPPRPRPQPPPPPSPGARPPRRVRHAYPQGRQPPARRDVAGLLLEHAGAHLARAALLPGLRRRGRLHARRALPHEPQGAAAARRWGGAGGMGGWVRAAAPGAGRPRPRAQPLA